MKADDDGVRSTGPSVSEALTAEMKETGEWGRHPWWRADPAVLSSVGLTDAMVSAAFAELVRVFDPAWTKASIKANRQHWFLESVTLPLKASLIELTELGLALAAIDAVSPAFAARLRRKLRDPATHRGAIFEALAAGTFARKLYRIDLHPRGRGAKELDLRVPSEPPLDIEVKGIFEDHRDRIARTALQAIGGALGDGIGEACQTSRYVRIDISEQMVSLLMGPPGQSGLQVASLTEYAKGLAAMILDVLRLHDQSGYARDTVAGVVCESWPRAEEGIQTTVYGPVVESRSVAEKIYRNALNDAAEKFPEGANGVVFVYLSGGAVDLGYFVKMWQEVTQVGVFRNIAAIVLTWRADSSQRPESREATILANPEHALQAPVVELLRLILGDSGSGIYLNGPPEPGPSIARRMMSINPWIVIPPLSEKQIVLWPNAEPPAHLVERFLQT